MSVYHTSFNYLKKNSNQDFGLIISHFSDGADSGEMETFLSMEPIYTDNAFGTKRIDYGAKYSSVAVFRITLLKQDGSELSVSNIRNYLKWLTGARSNSSLDLLIGDEIKYSFIGRFTNAWQYKMDARTCGLILEFTSISPWAYSPIQTLTQSVSGTTEIQIDNQSDDLYEYVYPKITYQNTTGTSLMIKNATTGETTEVNKLSSNEIITIDNNMMITTDKPSKTFGNTFNFVFPRFSAGVNKLIVAGNGNLTIEYIMYLKVGDCARDINAVYDPICSEDGTIQVDVLPWDRIFDTPTTLKGYGITDSYTIEEIDEMLGDITVDNVYTKPEVDDKISVLESQIADLLYKNITITSLSNDAGVKEKGMVVDVTIKWTTSKDPKTITLGGTSLDNTARSHVYRNISTDKSWALVVTGERDEKATKSTGVAFYDGVYYGVSSEPATYDSNFILSLSQTLSDKKVSPFTVTAGDEQYIYYCLPTSMGTCSFSVGGFVGGITLVDTIEFTNQHNHKEQYYIYRSDYPNLGTRNVLVS
jgi:hypothetical protein